jgi:predicted dehydrogenase
MARLRGAIFGAGRMGSLHQAKLAARPDVSLVVVDPARGLDPAVGPLDFAVVATPTTTHAAVARPLLERGVPCLVEKPLAADLADARRLASFDRVMVGHVERFNPAVEAVRSAHPRFVQCERLAPFTGRGTDVSVVDDLMVHDLDLVLTFLAGEVRDIRAIGAGVLTGGPDIANARIEIGAAVAVLTASRVSREPVRKLRLVEDGVYWSVDLLARAVQRVDWGRGALEAVDVPVPAGDPLEREHDAFLAAVRGDAPFVSTGREAVEALELAARVRDAIRSAG